MWNLSEYLMRGVDVIVPAIAACDCASKCFRKPLGSKEGTLRLLCQFFNAAALHAEFYATYICFIIFWCLS